MPKTFINGVNIYYESHGSGFPLVFTYGLGGSTKRWAGQIPAFSQRYRFIIWDPRGHGQTDSPPHPEQYGLHKSAEDLHGLLNHLGIDKAYVGGLSMGAGAAALFTINHPERVAALVITDSASAAGFPTSPAMRPMREKSIELAETQGMAAVAEYCMEANANLKTQAEAGPEAREALRQSFLDLNPIGYANTIRSHLEPDSPFPAERLPEITCPTLVLVGDQDPALEAAHFTHTKIAGSQYAVIPGGGHLSNLDRPEEYNSHILEFLQKVEAGVRA